MLSEQEIGDGVAGITDVALAILESNPESLTDSIEKRGPQKAFPSFISMVIKKILAENPDEAIEVIMGGIMGIYSILDEMLIESGTKMNPTKKQKLIQKCVEIVIQANPQLGPKVKALQDEIEAGGGNTFEEEVSASGITAEDVAEDPEEQTQQQQQGVF